MTEDEVEELKGTIRRVAAELTGWLATANAVPGLAARARSVTTLPGPGTPPGGVVTIETEFYHNQAGGAA